MLVAQRDQPAAAEPHHLARRRSAGAPQPEAEVADEHQTLRVCQLAAIAVLVLDDTAPQRHRADDRRVPGSVQQARIPSGVEPARAGRLRAPMPTPAGAAGACRLQGRPRRAVPGAGMHSKLGVATVRMKRPDPPARDGFQEGLALGPDAGLEKRLAHGEGAAGSAAGRGSAVGTGSAWGTGSASGSGRTSGTGTETGSTSKIRLGRPMFMRPLSSRETSPDAPFAQRTARRGEGEGPQARPVRTPRA